jgi:hypothetical protein
MGDKNGPVKCQECGARNDEGVRRCRVCANLLDIEAPEQRKGLALSPGELEAYANARQLAEEQGIPTDNLIEFDRPGVAPIELSDELPVPPPGSPAPPPPVTGSRTPAGMSIEFDVPGVEPLRLPDDEAAVEEPDPLPPPPPTPYQSLPPPPSLPDPPPPPPPPPPPA